MRESAYQQLATYAETRSVLNAVIEVPKGSRNRYKFEPAQGLFVLESVLPAGLVYPQDFGFLPSTLGEDGDPLDVMVLMDEPTFCGCVIRARLIGVLEARQTERDGRVVRNDRFLALPQGSPDQRTFRQITDLPTGVTEGIQRFFTLIEEVKGKQFHPLGEAGLDRALELIDAGMRAFEKSQPQGERSGA